MPVINRFPENVNVYRMDGTITNDIGETVSPTAANLKLMGTIKARINLGDSLEPDIRGSTKDYGQDVSGMWIGFFEVPVAATPPAVTLDIITGDILVSQFDANRKFQVQFIDKYPGGTVPAHHWEARLQSSESFQIGT